MDDLSPELRERARQDAVYERAMASLNRRNLRSEARGYAVMAAADGYGAGATGTGWFGKISHAAKLFCIAFAFLVPSLLVWDLLL